MKPTKKRDLIKRSMLSDTDDEKYILCFIIMHHNVAEAAYRYWKDGQLKLKHLTSIYRRQYRSVFSFYKKYGKAPRRTIRFIHQGAKAQLRSNEIDIEESLLKVIAQEYRAAREGYNVNPKYVIEEMLPRFIRSRKVEEINDKLENAIASGHTEKAEELLLEYKKVTSEPPDNSYGFTEPLTIKYHRESIEKKKKGDTKEIYQFHPNKGAISSLIGTLKRQWLVSVSGSTKSGKSYFLLDIGIDGAINQRKKVMYLCPEMMEEDMVEERIVPWVTERTTNKELSGIDYIPEIDCINNQTGQCLVLDELPNKTNLINKVGEKFSSISSDEKICIKWKTCTKCRGQRTYAKGARRRFLPAPFWKKQRIKISNDRIRIRKLKRIQARAVENLKIKYFPKYSVTIEDCFDIIRKYKEKHNWKPDIIIFDYLDVLRPSSGNKEISWQDIDHMWKLASGFAQEMDALVITADQTTKAGRTSRMVDHTVTPQASMKDHHVDLKIGVVKIEDETMNNICRVNIIYDRHRPFNRNNEVLITQNLTIGHAITDSVYWFDKHMPPYPVQLPEKNK